MLIYRREKVNLIVIYAVFVNDSVLKVKEQLLVVNRIQRKERRTTTLSTLNKGGLPVDTFINVNTYYSNNYNSFKLMACLIVPMYVHSAHIWHIVQIGLVICIKHVTAVNSWRNTIPILNILNTHVLKCNISILKFL